MHKYIVLESASLNPVLLRKPAKGIVNKYECIPPVFERGIDIRQREYCLKRAALLIHEIAGAIYIAIVSIYREKRERGDELNFDKINKLIGQENTKDNH